ncbi:MAG: hypothetical protein HYV63_32260 [Candidatus Schekmanbacteria bacterium]|nr:hypothetical protein [Candidatus Schekmanbacteria bacterium]
MSAIHADDGNGAATSSDKTRLFTDELMVRMHVMDISHFRWHLRRSD